MNGQEWCDAYGVMFDWSAQGFHADDQGWEHQLYTVTFSREGAETISFKWRQGLALEPIPSVSNVLYALQGDAVYGIQTFREFCSDLGYDPDSRKARKTWKACGKIARKFERFCSGVEGMEADFYNELREA